MATGLFSTPKKDFDLDKNPDWFDGQLNQLSPISVEPLISGYAFIKWLKVPKWVDGTGAPHTYFKQLTEKNLVSFKGNEDITLEDVKLTQGFSKTETSFAGGIGAVTSTFSMSHNEYSGSPVAKAYSYWVGGVRDPRTNIAVYPSFDHNPDKGKYGVKYHTGILLYAKTRPDFNIMQGVGGVTALDPEVIEYASLYTNVMPTKILTSHQDFEAGTNDKAGPLEMEFLCKKVLGDSANKLALALLGSIDQYAHMNDALAKYIDTNGNLRPEAIA
jgi:hypothetical protein